MQQSTERSLKMSLSVFKSTRKHVTVYANAEPRADRELTYSIDKRAGFHSRLHTYKEVP